MILILELVILLVVSMKTLHAGIVPVVAFTLLWDTVFDQSALHSTGDGC